MSKRIHHMGMTLDKARHDRFHLDAPALAPEKHDALMKKLGVTREEDEEWHRTHLTLAQQRALEARSLKPLDPLAAGAGFLAWCVKQGWVVQRRKQYFAGEEGVRELRARFGIEV